MKKFNRLLSLLLVVVMLAGLMTITAGAQTEETGGSSTPELYTVHYFNGNEHIKSVEWEYGKPFEIASYEKPGYILRGWSLTRDNTVDYSVASYDNLGVQGTGILTKFDNTNSLNLYAVLEAIEYTVTFNADGGTVSPASVKVYYGDTVSEPTATKAGFAIDGWYTSFNNMTSATKFVFGETKVTESINLYAKWQQEYTLVVGNITYKGTAANIKTHTVYYPTEVGKTHAGFTDGTNTWANISEVVDYMVANEKINLSVTPVYTASVYTVKYFDTDGTGEPLDTDSWTYGEEFTVNSTATKEGYTLKGWDIKPNGTLQYSPGVKNTLTNQRGFFSSINEGVLNFYAIWEENPAPTTYTVTFDSDGGSTVAAQTIESGKTASKPTDPTKENYGFLGWFKDGETAPFDFATPITADITLKAQWEMEKPPVPTSVSVDLDEVAIKYLVQKDSLPIKYNETFTVNVYEYNTGYGYGGYRPGRYVATLSATFERMKPMEKPGTIKPGFGFVPGYRYGCIIGTPVLSEFANIYKQTLSSKMSVVKGSETLTFDKPGTYYYKLVETDNRTPYMEYVSAAYLKIVVTQGEEGLVATYTPVKITNVYDKNGNVNSADNSSVTLTKVDSVDKTKVLQGAKFRLYQEGKYGDYEYFKTYTTDYNGEIEIFNLAAGDYYFVEVAAPTGYELDDSKIEFTIGKTTKTNDVELTVTNKKINIFTEDHFAYIQGYEDGTVRPQNNITRAEAATILFRLLDDGVRSKYWDTASSYADVSPAAWYNNAVATLENMGVLEVGVNYRPNDYITRAELAFMITNFYDMAALDIEGIALTDITGHVYETAIKQAAAMGWVKGYTDGSFNPDANITRAEAMTLINRVLGRAVEQRGMAAGMKTWPDNPVGAWYYEDVQEATNSHTYTRTTTLVDGYDFYYESWGSIQANTDWTALETTWATGK